MSALPPSQMRAMREAAATGAPFDHQTGYAARWAALNAKAEELARLAEIASPNKDIGGEEIGGEAFEELLNAARSWERTLAQRGIEDIEALMRPGLQALSTLVERGNPTQAPALALWREWHHARAAVLAALTPRRAAA